MRLVFAVAVLLCCCIKPRISAAQLDNTDIILAAQPAVLQDQHYYRRQGNNAGWMQARDNNAVAKYNPVSLTFKGLMFVYQHIISRQLSKDCPYYYTCSNYAKLAIHEKGLIKGILLAGDRLMRCNRIGLLDVNDLSVDESTHSIIDHPGMY
jgi:uncharacterized protein